MGFFSDIVKSLTPAPEATATPPLAELPPDAAATLFNHKKDMLAAAQEAAAGENRKPTLEDYRKQCEAFPTTQQGKAFLAAGGEWSPAIYADLSGQKIDGFSISEPQKNAPAKSEHDKRAMIDFMDHDGDGIVNEFYTNIDFTGANLKDCFVEPATSFNNEIAKAKSLEKVTFNDMKEGDKFTFGSGEYNDITLTNIKGGAIEFHGTKVHGLNMEGAKVASITMGEHTSISHLDAKDAHIVKIEASKGAEIHHANFKGATIDMASKFEGVSLNHVKFKDANLGDVKLDGASLNHVKFKDSELSNLSLVGAKLNDVKFKDNSMKNADFSGAQLHNVSIDGKAITRPEQLPDGVKFDAATRITATDDFIKQAKMESALELAKEAGKALLLPKSDAAGVEGQYAAIEQPTTSMATQAAAKSSTSTVDLMNYYKNKSQSGGLRG